MGEKCRIVSKHARFNMICISVLYTEVLNFGQPMTHPRRQAVSRLLLTHVVPLSLKYHANNLHLPSLDNKHSSAIRNLGNEMETCGGFLTRFFHFI